jgi:Protein of unknown function (DUF2971).
MNDPKELSHLDVDLKDLITTTLQQYYDEIARNGNWDRAELLNCTAIVQNAFSTIKKNFEYTFLTCFSNHSESDENNFVEYDEKNGLLSQWRHYTGESGIAICFKYDKLSAIVNAEKDESEYIDQKVRSVRYHGIRWSEQSKSGMADFIIGASKNNTSFLSSNSIGLAASFLQEALRSKPIGYRDEREVRIISRLPDPTDDRILQSDSIPIGFPYIKILDDENKLPISKVIIGPGIGQDQLQFHVRHVLNKKGYNVPVTKSEIQVII